MKFKLVEKWIDYYALPRHFESHKDDFDPPFYDMQDYEKAATDLAKHWPGAGMARDSESNYVGYVSQNGYFNIYNKASGSIVIFLLPKNGIDLNEEPLVISYYPLRDYKQYLWKMDHGESPEVRFKSELPHNKVKAEAKRARNFQVKKEKEEAERIAIAKENAQLEKEKRRAKYNKKFKK